MQRQGSSPANPYLYADNDPVDDLDLDENTNLFSVKRDPSGRGRQGAQQLRTVAHTVAELHPGVLATEAAYGRDCSGQELSAWERLGKGFEAIAGSIGGFLGRLGRLADEAVETVSQTATRAYDSISAKVNQLKRAWQVRQALKKVPWSKVPKPTVSDPKLQNIVNNLYRPGAKIGNGSTADAIRYEKATGCLVGGRSHIQKGWDYVRALQNWLRRNPNASPSDRQAAQDMLDDLLDALNWTP